MQRAIGLVAGCVLAAGCGASAVVPVQGQVVWTDGGPAGELVGYQVEAEVPGSKTSARGDIGPDGRFKLGTFTTDDGSEPGEHRVTITPIPRMDLDPAPKMKLPGRYGKADTSGLRFTVERGKANDFTLTVARK